MRYKMVDGNCITPLYVQVAENIKSKIHEGILKSGDRIGSINELVNQYNISRVTAIAAIESLVKSSYVVTKQGKGTFVKEGFTYDNLDCLRSFSEISSRSSREFTTKIINCERIKLDEEIMDEFNNNEREGLKIYRVHYFKNQPIGLIIMILPKNLIELCEKNRDTLNNISAYDLLSRHGYVITDAVQMISATGATSEIAEILCLDVGEPILYTARTSYDIKKQVMMLSSFYYKNDAYSYRVHLHRTEELFDGNK